MNTVAVLVGSLYGVAALGATYFVSMVASGLFTRSFYRIYARVLIGVCSVMVAAPLLKYVSRNPLATSLLLTVAGYLATGLLAYGVVRFNREFMQTIFLDRRLTAYFIFGTLANALVVTLVLLHVAASPSGVNRSFIGPGHYGPFLMLLAAMVFHTDFHLKLATGSGRAVGSFTFIGYAIALVAVCVSGLPYMSRALVELDLARSQLSFLQNTSCAQTLLLAILVFGCLAWKLGSVPPVYLLLLALCAEYYVLVTQWFVSGWGTWQGFGPSVCGLVSLPLLAGMDALSTYFVRWDRKRAERGARLEGEKALLVEAATPPRLVVPFRVVSGVLAGALVAVTLWTRFDGHVRNWSPLWLAATFGVFAAYQFAAAVLLRNASYVYAAGVLAGLGAVLGVEPAMSPWSTLMLSVLGAVSVGLSRLGTAFSLKREFRTALADIGLMSAVASLAFVACRHVVGLGVDAAYDFAAITSLGDLLGLLLTAATLVLAARVYRSRLPMYGVVLAAILLDPMFSAGFGLLACLAGELLHRFVKVRSARDEEPRLQVCGRWALPLEDTGPQLYARPLTEAALPVALLGLALSAHHVVWRELSYSSILGIACSSLVLGLLTRAFRWVWLYVLSLACAYFAIHAAASLVIGKPTSPEAISRHLLLVTAISIVGWLIAAVYSAWCKFWLRRVAEEHETALRARQSFYAGVLNATVFVAATMATAGVTGLVVDQYPSAVAAPAAAAAAGIGLALLYGLLGATYQSSAPVYLSVVAACLASYCLIGWLPPGGRGAYDALALSVLAAVCALFSALSRATRPTADSSAREHPALVPVQSPRVVPPGQLSQLWAMPLHHASILLPCAAMGHALASWGERTQLVSLAVLYVSAGVWFAATCSYQPGICNLAARWVGNAGATLSTQSILLAVRAERVALYVLSILGTYFAVHATAQCLVLSHRQFGDEQTIAWQGMVAGVMSVVGWVVATGYGLRCSARSRLAAPVDAHALGDRCTFYAGLLYHVTATVAVVTLGLLLYGSLGQDPQVARVTVVGSLILAGYFSLAGAVYRSKLGTYLSLVALSLVALDLLAVVPIWEFRGATRGAALAVLGLSTAVVSCLIWQRSRTAAESPQHGLLPMPWSAPPLPLTEPSWRRRWSVPLAEFSLLLAFFGVVVAAANSSAGETGALLMAFVATVGVCAIAGGLYRTSTLTYIAAISLWAAAYVGLIFLASPAAAAGPAVAVLALLLWGAGGAAAWPAAKWRAGAVREHDTEAPSLDVVIVFQRPLLRCAVAAALVAIGHGVVYFLQSRDLQPLLITCAIAAVTLLLVAGNARVLNLAAQARTLVHAACLAGTGGAMAAAASRWGTHSLALAATLMALTLAVIGLLLLERALRVCQREARAADMLRTYGEPITQFAVALPIAGITLSLADALADVRTDTGVGLSLGLTLIAASLTYLVTVRALRASWWLYPHVVLLTCGVVAGIQAAFQLDLGSCLLASVIMMNLCVCGARLIRLSRDRVGTILGVDAVGCERAFYWWPFAATAAIVVGPAMLFAGNITQRAGATSGSWPWLLTPLAAFLLFFHVLYLERHRLFVHALIGSGLLATLWWAALSDWTLTPDLALLCSGVFWAVVAVALTRPVGERLLQRVGIVTDAAERRELAAAAIGWVFGLFAAAILITMPVWIWMQPVVPSTSATLLVAAGGCLLASRLGRNEPGWYAPVSTVCRHVQAGDGLNEMVLLGVAGPILLLPAVWATLVFLHAPSEPISTGSVSATLPGMGLATGVLALLYTLQAGRLSRDARQAETAVDRPGVGRVLAVVSAGFTLIACGLTAIAAVTIEPALTTPAIAVSASIALVSVTWLFLSWQRQQEVWVYLAEAGSAVLYLYVRHGVFGAPFGPSLDKAFGIIALSFVLFGINVAVSRGPAAVRAVFQRPTFFSALALPTALLFVTPHGRESREVLSLVVFAAAAFYALAARRERLKWAAYVAAALVNVGLYVWVPQLSDTTHLLQLYVIPAAITLLVLVQLHHRDLPHQTLTGIRYAAAGAMLAVSSLDAFASAGQHLGQFILVLFLSLAGTCAGIALRVRPFVYVGLAFLVINVLGQLGLEFQRQHSGILRAAILIGVGFVVIGIMVYLNVRREEVLRRYRHFLADSRWD